MRSLGRGEQLPSVSTTRTELLVMLTPHVIHNADDMQSATDEMVTRMRNVPPIQVLPGGSR